MGAQPVVTPQTSWLEFHCTHAFRRLVDCRTHGKDLDLAVMSVCNGFYVCNGCYAGFELAVGVKAASLLTLCQLHRMLGILDICRRSVAEKMLMRLPAIMPSTSYQELGSSSKQS